MKQAPVETRSSADGGGACPPARAPSSIRMGFSPYATKFGGADPGGAGSDDDGYSRSASAMPCGSAKSSPSLTGVVQALIRPPASRPSSPGRPYQAEARPRLARRIRTARRRRSPERGENAVTGDRPDGHAIRLRSPLLRGGEPRRNCADISMESLYCNPI